MSLSRKYICNQYTQRVDGVPFEPGAHGAGMSFDLPRLS